MNLNDINTPTMELALQASCIFKSSKLDKASLLYILSNLESFASVKFLSDIVNKKETALNYIEEYKQDSVVKCLSNLIPINQSEYSALLSKFVDFYGTIYLFSFISGPSEEVQKSLK